MIPDDLLHRWPDAERILELVLDLPPDVRRSRALAACGDDAPLRRLVERLLEAGAEGTDHGPVLWGPVVDVSDALRDPAADLPAVVGAYRVLGELGRGGMSRVFRAVRDVGADVGQVALKHLDRRPTAAALRRFDRERETLARLQHPHIARLLDGGVDADGVPYLVMELVDGEPIDAYCDRLGLDVPARLRLCRQVLAAVEYAHAQLIVHRDIKPSNVFVNEHGQVKLLDFGIAKWLDEAATPGLTETQHRVLTPSYAAPEQFRGDPVTAATDVYQLGLLLYQLLTGRSAHAPSASTHEALSRAVLEVDPPPPSKAVLPAAEDDAAARSTRMAAARRRGTTTVQALARRLTGDLDAILLKALRKEPAARYPSVEALRRDVDNYLSSRPVSARRGTLLYAARKYAVRHRAPLAAAATASLALVTGLVVVLAQSRATAAERDRARQAEARATAINTFLVRDLLAAATPAGAQGQPLSVADVLANASRAVGFAFAGQRGTEAEVRLTLSDSYAALGRFVEAEAHARTALTLATTEADPLTALRIRAALARLALEQGRFDEARAEAEAVRGAQASAVGATHADTLTTTLLLSQVARRQGHLFEAEQLARPVLAAVGAAHAGDWRLAADARLRLADVLIDLRRGDEAEPLTREAVDLKRAQLGPSHPEVLAAMAQHGLALDAQIRFDDALRVAEELVRLHEQVYGPTHPRTASAYNNLAMMHDRLGHTRESGAAVDRALSIFRETLGPHHPDTVAVLRNKGILISRLDGPALAEPVYKEVLAIRRQTLPARHFAIIEAAVGLANLLARVPQHPGARDAALEVLQLCHELLDGADPDPRGLDMCAQYALNSAPAGLRSPATAKRLAERAVTIDERRVPRRLVTLALAQQALGETPAAMATMREALALPDALQSWTSEQAFVEMMIEHGTPADLEAWLLDRLEQFRQRRGPDDPLMSKTERHLALHYERAGRLAEAEIHHRSALARLQKTRPESDFEVGLSLSELGGVLTARGAYAEAEPLLLRGFASLVGDRRVGVETRTAARDRLVRLFEAWNRPVDAELWRRRDLSQPGPGDRRPPRP